MMLPGDSRWIHLLDDHRADVMRTARTPPYCSLLAQPLSSTYSMAYGLDDSALGGAVVPLLQLQSVRRPDRAGALVEVICVGRGLVQSVARHGQHGTATVEVMCDQYVEEEESTMAQTLHELHDQCQEASTQVRASTSDDVSGSFSSAAQESHEDEEPLAKLVDERRSLLRRRALRPDAGRHEFDAELLSFAAASHCLDPTSRKRALESTDTRERLQMCVDALRERHGRLMATLALQRVM